MSSVSMNIRMDKSIKEQAQELFAEFGLDMTTAINMFLRQSIREHRIPFELRINVPNEDTLEAIREVQQMKKNPSLGKSYNNVDDMMKELLA
ncbi:MAG: type II toxin-antitoxin system RelB/DinJ family antitoxin [Acutalibacteraceae bacterium]